MAEFSQKDLQAIAKLLGNMKNDSSKEDLKSSYSVFSKISKGQYTGYFNITGVKIMKGGYLLIANAHPRTPKGGKLTYKINNPNDTVERMKYWVKVHTTDMPHDIKEFPATYNPETQVLNIPELSMCITNNGSGYLRKWDRESQSFVRGKKVNGYFGRNYKKK